MRIEYMNAPDGLDWIRVEFTWDGDIHRIQVYCPIAPAGEEWMTIDAESLRELTREMIDNFVAKHNSMEMPYHDYED